ncbi:MULTISPECIES: ABC transporter ATP-binding protein [Thalassospira]|jgi:ABC-2 type transport system ATP-binding protein|uniref:ABC transporter ATP-binding protein n=1 Tax=Thalassospira povalilytica TaxID=732237 RepID=A0A8I1M5J8_9PROT|nr:MULTISPECIES: ABC transporter ATP-binding protein [Thalassospira]MEE3047362.1 ABC transporter ATP-binding protein [Pseudomonadota bacterium]RCK28009.1 multidrug ABC transporter ATP-binding protein [Thalassospira profundimaris]MBN8195359.1 ABC transporter ATP-binding protein [Thalassospira povalilytica]MBO6770304.1 ABC transporter ATP-binding protein [Thalassospira sp.]PKR49894.1 multidrug ABC transporter ATP-binding protein [Thalassospira povalilytica]
MTAMPDYAIEVEGLTKVYTGSNGEKLALDNVSLKIPRGSFFALLGPNGAGKSTFINILAGLVTKTGGTAKIWGHDIEAEMRAARCSIGIVPQELNLDAFFTPRQVMELQAGLYGVPKSERRTDEILAALGLSDKADSYARSLSGGMRRRLLVGKAMVHTPPVLVLDEPTAGVDIELRQQLWAYVKELNKAGVTIVLTTHYLEEAEELCDEIAIINKGNVIAHEDKRSLLRRIDHKTLVLTVNNELNSVPDVFAQWGGELKSENQIALHYRPSNTQMAEILQAVQGSGLAIKDLSTEEGDLEDIFLMLTRDNDKLRAGKAA